MKRIINHPPEQNTGRKYWRSLAELNGSSEFTSWLHREFPQGAAEIELDGVSRRNFLQLMGASVALAGLGLSGCRRPEAYLVPFSKNVEHMVPGKFTRYATTMPRRTGGKPLLVTCYEGRPTKIEGNPEHAVSQGKSDGFSQASVLELYDPERSHGPLLNGAQAEWDKAYAALDALVAAPGKTAFLVDAVTGPTRERLRGEIAKRFPGALWVVYDPLLPNSSRARVDFSKADIILSLDADFLGSDEGGLAANREYAKRRSVEKGAPKMNRLYSVEPRYTLTGGAADHRLRFPASRTVDFVAALARELGVSVSVSGDAASVPADWVRECAADLKANRGKSVVVLGAQYPAALQQAVRSINEALEAGGIVKYEPVPAYANADSITELTAAVAAGAVETLFIIGGNPIYTLPADVEVAKWKEKIKNRVHLGLYQDESAAWSNLHIPLAHYLESWGDTWAEDGSYCSVQPLLEPLWSGVSDIEFLARLSGRAKPVIPTLAPAPQGLVSPAYATPPEPSTGLLLVQETFGALTGALSDADKFEKGWKNFLRLGFDTAVNLPLPGSIALAAGALAATTALSKDALEVVFVSDYSMDDGRFANNGWLQEFPDPITKQTWGNAALISPKTAKELGVRSRLESGSTRCDVVNIVVDGRKVQAPVLIAPGHADYSITVALGYGRSTVGVVGTGSGFNAYSIRSSSSPYVLTGAKIEKLGHEVEIAITQEHQAMEGRSLVREATAEYYNENPTFARQVQEEAHSPTGPSFYSRPGAVTERPALTNENQWAMTIDLNSCVGCNACSVACQAENNIPIVGKDQVIRGREMAWIRIDRYFATDVDISQIDKPNRTLFSQDDNPYESDADMLFQPLGCQQCENAPCETVCPVNATVHSDDGLNVMAYNRCIGTRYCGNNCPYKVRRFNYFDYNQRPVMERTRSGLLAWAFGSEKDGLYAGPTTKKGSPETIKMQKNPNVTVRMRGVMEKCTFCVQRIEEAKISTLVNARDSKPGMVPTDSFQVACQQACPSGSITFGNKNDENSAVSKLFNSERSYKLLAYLNTEPRVQYLAKIRNPNMKMPGADKVGMSTVNKMHHHAGEGHGEGHAEAGHGEASAHGEAAGHATPHGGHGE